MQGTYCGGWRRCACLDAKTRVLAVGALASTTCNNFIADLLFLSEVSHSLLVAGAPCVKEAHEVQVQNQSPISRPRTLPKSGFRAQKSKSNSELDFVGLRSPSPSPSPIRVGPRSPSPSPSPIPSWTSSPSPTQSPTPNWTWTSSKVQVQAVGLQSPSPSRLDFVRFLANKTFGLAGKIGVAVVVWQLELLAHRCAKGLILPAHDIVLVGARSAQVKMQLDQYVDIYFGRSTSTLLPPLGASVLPWRLAALWRGAWHLPRRPSWLHEHGALQRAWRSIWKSRILCEDSNLLSQQFGDDSAVS